MRILFDQLTGNKGLVPYSYQEEVAQHLGAGQIAAIIKSGKIKTNADRQKIGAAIRGNGANVGGNNYINTGAGRDLFVVVVGRQPDLDVVSLGGGEAHVSGAEGDSPKGKFQPPEDLLGVGRQRLKLSG